MAPKWGVDLYTGSTYTRVNTVLLLPDIDLPDHLAFLPSSHILVCHTSKHCSPFSNFYIFTCNCQFHDNCFFASMKLRVPIKCFWSGPTPETHLLYTALVLPSTTFIADEVLILPLVVILSSNLLSTLFDSSTITMEKINLG